MTDQVNPFEQDTPPANPFADKLNGIKGEDGNPKYKDVDTALEALGHSQSFIETLKTESKTKDTELATAQAKLVELQAELDKRASVEDVVDRITQRQEPVVPADQSKNEPQFDETKVAEVVTSILNSNNQQAEQEKNMNTVVQTLTQSFGDKAAEVVAKKAEELGTTPDNLQALAKTNPKMVLSLFGDVKPVSSAPSTSSINLSSVPKPKEEIKIEKSLTRGGATNNEMADVWRKVRTQTHEKLGVIES